MAQSAPFLGPMMAVTLAICLSYIHLDRFRHREVVREHAQKCHISLLSKMDGERKNTDYWRRLCKLAEQKNENNFTKIGKKRLNSLGSCSEVIYSLFFMKARDRHIAIVGAAASPILLFYWTGYLMGYLAAIASCPAMEGLLLLTYIFVSGLIASMILSASFGPQIVDWVKDRIDAYEYEINSFTGTELQQKAQQSSLD